MMTGSRQTMMTPRKDLAFKGFQMIFSLDKLLFSWYNVSMKNKIVYSTISVLILILVVFATKKVVEWKSVVERAESSVKISKKLQYYQEAERIDEYYSRNDITARVVVIRETLQAIDTYLPKYFPNGPYTRNDLIAMAMVESGFDQYLVGTRKEFGIFQIMPEACKDAGVNKNQFDIKVNTELALIVLSWKYQEHPDYKIGMIAYNGLVKKGGKLSEIYWKKFIKARKAVDDLLSDSYIPAH